MRIAVIGRTEMLYNSALVLESRGFELCCVVTARSEAEYTRDEFDFERLATERGIPFFKEPGSESLLDGVREAKCDLAISVNYPKILSQECIDVFPLGILNAHGGDLPRYRGNACQAWAILNGESEIGLCIHKMIGGEVDAGDIIAREYLNIDIETRIGEVWDWMREQIPQLMLAAVKSLALDPSYILERQSNRPKDVLRCYPRRPADGRIDWGLSAIEIVRLVKASGRPFAGAFCDLDGCKVTIWDAQLLEDEEIFCAVPGQVVAITGGRPTVACGSGKVELVDFEIADGPRESGISSIRQRLQ